MLIFGEPLLRVLFRQFREHRIVAGLPAWTASARRQPARSPCSTSLRRAISWSAHPDRPLRRRPNLQGFIESRKDSYYRFIVTPTLIRTEEDPEEKPPSPPSGALRRRG